MPSPSQLDASAIPLYWFNDSAFKSLFFDAGSIAIPPAEHFVRETMEDALKRVSDPALTKMLEDLREDERLHSMVHDGYNTLLETRGLRFAHLAAIDTRIAWFFHKLDLRSRLAVCAGVEHLTALMSCHLLEHYTLTKGAVAEPVRKLWTWHSIEEMDHRSTALTVYRHLRGGYLRRIALMMLICILYALTTSLFLMAFLRQRGLLFSPRVWRDGMGFLLGRNGLYRSVLKGIGTYLRPGFSPELHIRLSRPIEAEERGYEEEVLALFARS